MKNILVLGIHGTFGKEIAKTLHKNGLNVTGFARSRKHMPKEMHGIQITYGDIADANSLKKAVQNIDVIIYAINPPKYNWKNTALPYLDNVARLAEQEKLTLVFPGNVYVFDPNDGPNFYETDELKPTTEKGYIRQAMEQRLKQASKAGAKVIILRMGDFISNNPRSCWLPHLIKPHKNSYTLLSLGQRELTHTWAHLPDAANIIYQLILRSSELAAYNVFHYRGIQFSSVDLAKTIEEISGKKVKLKNFPWLIIKLMSPFSTLFSGMYEMRYLWDKPINLVDDKLKSFLGEDLKTTCLKKALLATNVIKLTNKT
ncbi:MAG TPA: NAD-dependent epimerase/dehydratase family protein [Gammaproteobacteria bacterium]|nr:NAD-dependent epimerase/dehydratase family protein [Gammaproteobacteria bacterium]